ncbi:MAG: acyl-CoA dehydrogenase, partial [Ilumatobacteraceae bacterium]
HSQLHERAVTLGRSDDPVIADLLTQVYIGEHLIEWNGERNLHPSIGKLWRTHQGRLAAQVAHLIGGPYASAWEKSDEDADYWAYHMLNCRGMSLGGGTDEIQRNTLGERALGLPREPSTDREMPFRDLPRN